MVGYERAKSLVANFPTIIATASTGGKPNLAPVTDAMFLDEKTILIAHNEMVQTVKNIQENQQVSLLIMDEKHEGMRVFGVAEYSRGGVIWI